MRAGTAPDKSLPKGSDIVLSSAEIKRLVRSIIDGKHLSLYRCCESFGCDYKRIKQWLNARGATLQTNQEEVVRFCDGLGVQVRVSVVVKPMVFSDGIKSKKPKVKAVNEDVSEHVIEKIRENGY